MESLEHLNLDQIRVVDPWSNAQLGAILQIEVDAKPAIGMRCYFDAANGRSEAVLIVSGKNAGKLVLESDLEGARALDISALVKIAAVDPLPRNNFPSAKAGALVFHKTAALYVWFEMLKGTGMGFICVSGASPGHQVGSFRSTIDAKERVMIAGKTIAVEISH